MDRKFSSNMSQKVNAMAVNVESTVSRNTNSDLPTNVSTLHQVEMLPEEYQSGNEKRPLLSKDSNGNLFFYALKPMTYSAILILIVEAMERFSYYGVSYTQLMYMTGQYDADWNAGIGTSDANSIVSTSTAIAYTAPFIGGFIADCILGDFWTVIVFVVLFYVPGLLLICLTAKPYLLGSTFSTGVLTAAFMGLYPLGAGGIKAVVNIFGAKQFHPVLQSDMIETYYVRFYMCINIGALIGGIIIPIIAQYDTFVAYLIPVCLLSLGIGIFSLGYFRYVRAPADGKTTIMTWAALIYSLFCCSRSSDESKSIQFHRPGLSRNKESFGGTFKDNFIDNIAQLLAIFPISALIIPFNIAYGQMLTSFITQGTAMKPSGIIDAAMMQNADAISVLIFGALISSLLYPALAKRGKKIPTTYKFAFGTFLALMSMSCSLIIEYMIHSKYNETGEQISIFWQIFPFVFIGAGEIFAVSAAYEAVFNIAPKEQKAFASAINLFLIGGVPNFISTGLFNACSSWFQDSSGSDTFNTSNTTEYMKQYSETEIYNYFWVLWGICVFGIAINLLPPVKKWVERIEAIAKERNLHAQMNDNGSEINESKDSLTFNLGSMNDNENNKLSHAEKVVTV